MAAEYADGAALVSLGTISDPSLVPSAVAATLGVRPAGTATPEQSLQRFLAERELLLVLDNFEQVLPAGLLVAALLAGSPRLKVLGTSRTSLQIQGEQQFEVPP